MRSAVTQVDKPGLDISRGQIALSDFLPKRNIDVYKCRR